MRICSSNQRVSRWRGKLVMIGFVGLLFFTSVPKSTRGQNRSRYFAAPPAQSLIELASSANKFQKNISSLANIPLVIAPGVPLRVMLAKPLRIKKVGQPVHAVLADDVYSFDRIVLPKGTMIEGHITAIFPPRTAKRIESYLNADFSPESGVRIAFDTLTLKNGKKIPIQVRVLPGFGPTVVLTSNSDGNDDPRRKQGRVSRLWHETISQAKPSALWQHAKSLASSESPFHRQKFEAGTTWDLELKRPLDFGSASIPSSEFAKMGELPASNTEVCARLAVPLSSATAQKGMPVNAILTRPVFSPNHELLLPVGTELEGIVVKARPARLWHRNGQLHFTLSKVHIPKGAAKRAEMALDGMDVSRASGIQLDDEGEPHVQSSKASRAIRTAISIGVANATMSEDRDGGVVDPAGHNVNRALGGGSGYKIIGFVLTAAVKSRTFSEVMGFFGAGKSFYAHFVAPGRDLVLPQDTPMRISFGQPPLRPSSNARKGG